MFTSSINNCNISKFLFWKPRDHTKNTPSAVLGENNVAEEGTCWLLDCSKNSLTKGAYAEQGPKIFFLYFEFT